MVIISTYSFLTIYGEVTKKFKNEIINLFDIVNLNIEPVKDVPNKCCFTNMLVMFRADGFSEIICAVGLRFSIGLAGISF